jgi:hypothetical protein
VVETVIWAFNFRVKIRYTAPPPGGLDETEWLVFAAGDQPTLRLDCGGGGGGGGGGGEGEGSGVDGHGPGERGDGGATQTDAGSCYMMPSQAVGVRSARGRCQLRPALALLPEVGPDTVNPEVESPETLNP